MSTHHNKITEVIESVFPDWTVYTIRYSGGAVKRIDSSIHTIPKTLFNFLANPRVSQVCIMAGVNRYYIPKEQNNYEL